MEIIFGFMKGLDQAFAAALVLNQQWVLSEQPTVAVFAVNFLDARFKRSDFPAYDGAHFKKNHPKNFLCQRLHFLNAAIL